MNSSQGNYNIKRRSLTSGPHLFGSLLILAGLLVLVSPVIFEQENSLQKILGVGLGVILFGLVIISSYEGMLFNFTENTYKEYTSICGFKMGDWQKLPAITTINVISKNYFRTNKPNGISPTFSGEVTDYRILIFSEKAKPEFSLVFTKKEKAEKHAKMLATNLGAELIVHVSEEH